MERKKRHLFINNEYIFLDLFYIYRICKGQEVTSRACYEIISLVSSNFINNRNKFELLLRTIDLDHCDIDITGYTSDRKYQIAAVCTIRIRQFYVDRDFIKASGITRFLAVFP